MADSNRRKKRFFGLHFDLHPRGDDTRLGEDLTESMVRELITEVKPDFVQYDCKGHPGYAGYPTKVGWPSPGIVKDSLAIWRKVTKEYGVDLYVHYSGIWDSLAIIKHPEWARIDADGKRDENATSTFGPYCRELLIPQLKEAIDAYDLDGTWIDGDCWAVKPDFSKSALRAFTKRTGIQTIPRRAGDPYWNEFMEFQREAFREYLRRYTEALHKHKPTFAVASNWMFSTLAPEPVTVGVDFISGDFSPTNSVNAARFEARYMASTGKPWDLMAWGFNKGRDCQWSTKTSSQLKQEASIVLAQGGGFQIYYQPTRSGWIDQWMVRIMADVARFCRARRSLSFGTRAVPQVALLLSKTDLYRDSERLFGPWGGRTDGMVGMLHALLELHYSVDVLGEHHLAERLHDYPLLVLPEVRALPAELRKILIGYVEDGGSALLVGAEIAKSFEGLLGVRVKTTTERSKFFIEGGDALAWMGGRWGEIETTSADPLGRGYPSSDTRKNETIIASINRLGRGIMAGFYGPFGSVYQRSHTPAARRCLGEMMKKIFQPVYVEVSAQPSVEVVLREKRETLLMHLINTNNMQVSADYPIIGQVPPTGPIAIEVRMESRPREVLLEPGGSPVVWDYSGGQLAISVDSLAIHSVLTIR